jgi:hypothetical protein
MQATPVSLRFSTLPSVWSSYPRVLMGRRPALVPAGGTVPAIDARIERLGVNTSHLRDYRRVCGFGDDGHLPLTYPHVMAMPLQLAMLTSDAFPVRLLGLVHVRNLIRSHARIPDTQALDVTCSLSGHRETDRGQEFDMVTECRGDGATAWSEVSTFLARRLKPRDAEKPRAPKPAEASDTPDAVTTMSWKVPADIGRRYASVSGDFNPIHLADLSARLFGFDSAIAHGMWSLARTVAELGTKQPGPVAVEASFKLPIHLPAWVNLHHWETDSGLAFMLKDAPGIKPHMTGSFVRL